MENWDLVYWEIWIGYSFSIAIDEKYSFINLLKIKLFIILYLITCIRIFIWMSSIFLSLKLNYKLV